MKELKEKVSITLDTNVVSAIKNLAENDERSFSQYINLILKNHLLSNNNSISYNDSNTPKLTNKVAESSNTKK